MDAIAQPRAAVPEPPGCFTNVWDVLVAFLLAGIGVAAAAMAAILAGVLSFTPEGKTEAIDWPWVHSGAWSIAANVVATAGVLLLCAVAIARRLSRRAGEPVSWLRLRAGRT